MKIDFAKLILGAIVINFIGVVLNLFCHKLETALFALGNMAMLLVILEREKRSA